MTANIRFSLQGKSALETTLSDMARRVQSLESAWQRFSRTQASAPAPGPAQPEGEAETDETDGGGGASRLGNALRQMGGGGRSGMGRRALGFGMEAAGAFGIGNGTQRFFQGINTAYNRDIQAGELAKGIKDTGETLDDFRTSLLNTGKALGTTNDAIMQLASSLSAVTGKVTDFNSRMYDIQAGGMRLGLTPQQGNAFFIGEAGAGVTTGRTLNGGGAQLSDKQLTGDLAEAIAAGNMRGRQAEMVESLQTLTRQIQGVTVDAPNTLNLLSLMTTMNQSGVQGLMGQQGAAILSRINQGIQNPGGGEAGTALEYQAMIGNGTPISYTQYLYNREAGLDAKTTDGQSLFGRMLEQIANMPGSQYDKYAMASQEMGLSLHEAQGVMQQFIGPDGKFNAAQLTDIGNMVGGTANLKNYDTTVVGLLGELASGKSKTTDVAQEANSELGLNIPLDASQSDIITALKGTGTKLTASEQMQKDQNDLAKNAEDLGNSFVGLKKTVLEASDALGPAGVAIQMLVGGMLLNGGMNLFGGGGGGNILNLAKNVLGGGAAETAVADTATTVASDVAVGTGASTAGSTLTGAATTALSSPVAVAAAGGTLLTGAAIGGAIIGDQAGMAKTNGQGVSVLDPAGGGKALADKMAGSLDYTGMTKSEIGAKLQWGQGEVTKLQNFLDAESGIGQAYSDIENAGGIASPDQQQAVADAKDRMSGAEKALRDDPALAGVFNQGAIGDVRLDDAIKALIASIQEATKTTKAAMDAAPTTIPTNTTASTSIPGLPAAFARNLPPALQRTLAPVGQSLGWLFQAATTPTGTTPFNPSSILMGGAGGVTGAASSDPGMSGDPYASAPASGALGSESAPGGPVNGAPLPANLNANYLRTHVHNDSQQAAAVQKAFGVTMTESFGGSIYYGTHQGMDVGLAANAPVKMVQGGRYVAAYSADYQSVWDIGNGLYATYHHINATHYQDGQYVPAGTVIGTVAASNSHGGTYDPNTGVWSYTFKDGKGETLHSSETGPHLHYQISGSAADAGHLANGLDPTDVLNAATSPQPASAASSGTTGGFKAMGMFGAASSPYDVAPLVIRLHYPDGTIQETTVTAHVAGAGTGAPAASATLVRPGSTYPNPTLPPATPQDQSF